MGQLLNLIRYQNIIAYLANENIFDLKKKKNEGRPFQKSQKKKKTVKPQPRPLMSWAKSSHSKLRRFSIPQIDDVYVNSYSKVKDMREAQKGGKEYTVTCPAVFFSLFFSPLKCAFWILHNPTTLKSMRFSSSVSNKFIMIFIFILFFQPFVAKMKMTRIKIYI